MLKVDCFESQIVRATDLYYTDGTIIEIDDGAFHENDFGGAILQVYDQTDTVKVNIGGAFRGGRRWGTEVLRQGEHDLDSLIGSLPDHQCDPDFIDADLSDLPTGLRICVK